MRGSWSIFKNFWWATQNLLMFSFLIFLVISFKKLAQRVWVQNTQTGRQWDLRKISYVKMKTKSTRYILWLISCIMLKKEFISLTMLAIEKERKNSLIIVTIALSKICFIKNLNLIDLYYHWKNLISASWNKMS